MFPPHDDREPQRFVTDSRRVLTKVESMLSGRTLDASEWSLCFRLIHAVKATATGLELNHVAVMTRRAELLCSKSLTDSSYREPLRQAVAMLMAALAIVEREGNDSRLAQSSLYPRASLRASRLPSVPQAETAQASEQAATGEDDFTFFCLEADTTPVNSAQLPEEFLIKFVAESEEHLTKVEETLVALESGGATEEQLADAFRAMHSFKGNCGICGFPDMERLTHRAETLMGDYRDKRRSPGERDISFLLSLVDVLRAGLATIPGGDGCIANVPDLLAGFDALDNRHSMPPSTAQPDSGLVQRAVRAKADGSSNKGVSSIRVDTTKLDELMNLVGELIIAETTVTKNPDLDGYEFENFQKAALNLNRLTRSLQDIAMAVRMLPIAGTFRKMTRLVRDVGSKQKKRIELICTGEETEVDKTVIETIADPLVHLIRNSIDHGVETPSERLAAAKEAVGHVWLDAKHQGGEVWITIRDDGRGLNAEKILNKAIERGLAELGRRYTEREIFEFIFAAGFSTAEKLTDISGRGVGMDVVRRNVEAVNGRIDVSSEAGRGTTFVLRIPLTLAIIEGMLVRVGSSYYTIPLLAIRESVRAQESDITRLSDGTELLKLRRKHYPIVRLRDAGARSARLSSLAGILVIVEAGERLVCVLVDEVVGQRQTVIKPLPEYIKRVRGVAGCSILHNGEISLILDVEGVVGAAEHRAA